MSTSRLLHATAALLLAAGTGFAGSSGEVSAHGQPAPSSDVILTDFTPPQGGTDAAGSLTERSRAGGGPTTGPAVDVSVTAPRRHRSCRADDFKGGPGCSIQCITSGVAYARGVGAELVVTTDTPARIWIMVWDDDGYHRIEDSGTRVQSFSVRFDDLQPGTEYQALAAAEDAEGYQSDGYGTFHTLHRNVEVSFFTAEIYDAPYGDDFFVDVWGEGQWFDYPQEALDADGSTLELGINVSSFEDTDRYLDFAVQLKQIDDAPNLCEHYEVDDTAPSSGSSGCYAWAYAMLAEGWNDLDDRPADATSWTEHTLQRTLMLPGGDSLPGTFGASLSFSVPVSLHVTYD